MKLIDYPLLNSVLRMVLYERLFRVAVICLLLLGIGLVLLMARLWTATPRGFSPAVKLRGLDYVSAWALRRNALKQEAAGRFGDALYSWGAAVVNNPADPELLRGCLRVLRENPDKRKSVRSVVSHARWLLRLTQTNQADLELSASVYQAFDLNDLTLQTLAPSGTELPPNLEAYYLKALFNLDRFKTFADRLQTDRTNGLRFTDAELPLYVTAYEAGWGPLNSAAQAAAQLHAAKTDPNQRLLAHRLQLKVSEHLVQPEVYRASLEFLEEQHQDRLQDHIGYWQLLAGIGRKAQALELIKSHVAPPTSGAETVLLAKAYFDLGDQEQSRQILAQYAPQYADSEAVWLTYSNLLIAQERWDELAREALLVRHEDNPLRDSLAGYSYYIEGLAELRRGRAANAQEIFKKIPATKVENQLWDLVIAERLEMLGFPEIAKDTLLSVHQDQPESAHYWVLLAKTAFDIQDPDLLVSALASAYKINPDEPLIVNNYAAALLSTRQRPEVALQLTTRALGQEPNNPGRLINHSLALLQNQRFADAESMLSRLDATKLTGGDLSSYYYALFELRFRQQHYEQAKQAAVHIEPQYLLKPEKQWLQSARDKMEGPTASKG